MILDGWGIAKDKKVSAIDQADTPFVDGLYSQYPHGTLDASGLAVGLPEGQMGNSEVGHMNIGAGRIVYQDLVRVNRAIESGELESNQTLRSAISHAAEKGVHLHFMGLVSDGGVHSHINHLLKLCEIANTIGMDSDRVFIHAFTDGRDCDPRSGKGFIQEVQERTASGRVATVVGRYYAMDRDKRWNRIKVAYDALVQGIGEKQRDVLAGVDASYTENITDEFIKPILLVDENDTSVGRIQKGDVVICFNFRTDRCRQITTALTQEDFPEEGMEKMDLTYLTLTNYDDSFRNVGVIFDKEDLTNTLGEVLQNAGKKQIRIAETEKYPHVTFFFSGGREKPFDGERRILCPSPTVATYDLKPEMSANDIKDHIIPELENETADFICLNFANPDMVGHTGVFEAAVTACETVDTCAQQVVTAALGNGYTTIIIADHGNSDIMVNPDGTPHTAHTTNLVPCIVVDAEYQGPVEDGKLGDLAPTILKLMDLKAPEEMTGQVLIR